jgi:predicted glutamine amidotransferase
MKLPSKQILETCFKNNPDGAGFMYATKGQVYIKKGFMDYHAFESNLNSTLKKIDEIKTPMVLHFRITTQGGVNQACTHPFPLSKQMNDLRQLNVATEIGVAHNGIISLTSEGYYSYKSYNTRVIDYSDTMKFITDYLSLIIKSPKYYKDDDTIELIERLCGSKLAILDCNGHCELIGNFTKDSGIYYSNDSYKPRVYKATKTKTKTKPIVYDDYDDYDDYGVYGNYGGFLDNAYDDCWDNSTGEYDFDILGTCPILEDCDPSYCAWCTKCNNCNRTMPITIPNFKLGKHTLKPSKEFYRINGYLYGISYDEDDNMYEVCYEEGVDDCTPSDAVLVSENEKE